MGVATKDNEIIAGQMDLFKNNENVKFTSVSYQSPQNGFSIGNFWDVYKNIDSGVPKMDIYFRNFLNEVDIYVECDFNNDKRTNYEIKANNYKIYCIDDRCADYYYNFTICN